MASAACDTATGCPSSADGYATSKTRTWPRRWDYVSATRASAAEAIGFDLSLIAELNLNDIKGEKPRRSTRGPPPPRWPPSRSKLELMVAVRPTFHNPALLAKQAANIDRIAMAALIAERRLQLVGGRGHQVRRALRHSTTTATRAPRNGSTWSTAAGSSSTSATAAATTRWPTTCCSRSRCAGRGPTIYAGGESEAAKNLIASKCDAYLMHGDPPEIVGRKIADMRERRERLGLPPDDLRRRRLRDRARHARQKRSANWHASRTCSSPRAATRIISSG